MSNSIIPHFVSDSPPPIANNDEEDYDDEFGDFTGPGDLSFDNDLSTPSTPKNSTKYADNYSPFELNKVEHKNERNIRTEDKSTNDFVRSEMPSKNFINILDQIENNSLKIIKRNEEDILKENNEVEGNLKESSYQKELNEYNLKENGDNLTANIIQNDSPTKIKNADDGLKVLGIVTTAKPDIVNSPLGYDIRKNHDINDFRVVPPEKLSGNVNDFCNSEDDFPKCSTLISKNTNLKDELDTEIDISIIVNGSHGVTCTNDNAAYSNGEISFDKVGIGNKEQKINVTSENQVLNLPVESDFEQEDINNRTKFECEATGEVSNYQASSNNFRENYEESNRNILTSDEFNSTNPILPPNTEELKIEELQIESSEDFGEFADFKTSNFDINTNNYKIQSEVEDVGQIDDDFAEFGDFEHCQQSDLKESNDLDETGERVKQGASESKQDVVPDGELDDFDDFADYSTFSKPNNDNDDDFDNFCDYSAFNRQNSDNNEDSVNIKICKEPQEAFEHSQIILKDMFEQVEAGTGDYINSEITLGNSVFENLKEITETNALIYQWEKSSAQKNILKTLNIDIRNILYGPTWNAGIPIFAANLCSTPLEPIKSEVTSSPASHKPMQPIEPDRPNLATDIPLAEFDWSGAGLTNPLDYSASMLLDLGELVVDCSPMMGQDWEQSDSPTIFDDWDGLGLSFEVADKNLEITACSKEASEIIAIADVTTSDNKTKLDQKNDVPINSQTDSNDFTNDEGSPQMADNEEDFGDFASYQPSFEQDLPWTGKMLPLRESYISYQPSSAKEEPPIAQTYVKPDVESAMSNFNLSFLESKSTSTETPEVMGSSKSVANNDLGLFSLLENKPTVEETSASSDEFKNFKTESYHQNNNFHISEISSVAVPAQNLDDTLKITETISEHMETLSKQSNYDENAAMKQDDLDDEFTDFHSSLPNQVTLPLAPTHTFPEPLKPAVLQPVPVTSVGKIDWPEPGLDEDEVSRIVAGCLRRKSDNESEVVRKNEPTPVHQKKVTEPQNDDEEWSDFVSVKEPAKSRTSTPDLPLSVLNLGSLEPVKAPTPVLTPNGLICSPAKKPLPNLFVPKSTNNLQRNIQHQQHQKHPFITSQAFDALYQNPKKSISLVNNSFSETPRQIPDQSLRNSNDQKTNIFNSYFDMKPANVSKIGSSVSQQNADSYGKFQHLSSCAPRSSEDDEEWGDFVSANNATSPFNSNLNSMYSATHIITNPSHFMGALNKNVSSDQYSSSSKSTVVRQERRNIPSISALPDLDFVSPRTRTAKK